MTTLDQLLALARSFQESRILLTSIELDVFTLLGDGATAEVLAVKTKSNPRAARMLLDALTAMGLLVKNGTLYRNGELASAYLDDAAPGSLRASLLHDAYRWRTWSNLTARVKGESPPERHRELEPERHRALLAMLDRKALGRAPKLVRAIGCAGVRRLLDLGGGSAAYSIAFARAEAALQAEVVELAPLAPITEEYVARAGLSSRIRVHAADFQIDDLGHGFDLILLFSVAHLLGEPENRQLLARCHHALAPGGRVAIHDHILDASRTHPRAGALFAVNMLLASGNGGTYTYDEYLGWLHAAGFGNVERHDLANEPTAVLTATR